MGGREGEGRKNGGHGGWGRKIVESIGGKGSVWNHSFSGIAFLDKVWGAERQKLSQTCLNKENDLTKPGPPPQCETLTHPAGVGFVYVQVACKDDAAAEWDAKKAKL